jgi:hypothetical protein
MIDLIKDKGYWQANGKYFDIKMNAILEAQSTNSDVTFHYNDEAWDQADWTVEPEPSLDEFYLQRARDLRAKYKTLILRFSGGADSMNILRTFVDNNIKIDVIVVNEYFGLNKDDRNMHPGSAEKLAITLPCLDKLQQQGYVFERLELDNSKLFHLLGDDPDWIFRINTPRFRLVELSAPRTVLHPELQRYNSTDTCLITGLDKPHVFCKNEKVWYFLMPDYAQVLADPGHSLIVQEPFYWTADLPELVIKQCHVIKNYASAHIDQWPSAGKNLKGTTSKKWVVPLLYPKYFNFKPGDPLPYFNIPVENDPGPLGKVLRGFGPYCNMVDYGIERMPIYETHLRGVQLADRLMHRRFKAQESIFGDGVLASYSKKRWLGR